MLAQGVAGVRQSALSFPVVATYHVAAANAGDAVPSITVASASASPTATGLLVDAVISAVLSGARQPP